MEKNKKRGLTLVELVVVISILGVLSAISFVSFIGYSEDARDATRVNNVNLIYNSLETAKTTTGKYPTPDNSKEITYEGKVLWRHGIIGEGVSYYINSGLFIDPKYKKKKKNSQLYFYYGVLSDNTGFQIGTILEDETNKPLQ
ncbi:hypothetical protein CSB08_00360 [Candidatus Gracilibacteria bacterium]|nr:MAG: hypothetical protein CSB08_00360 [Candidatus Gracilibacteria bacterium]PIE85295.1 MAG: hypothetical protein CSA08_02710 [Candidatus Gracilibacteria bacterium]